MMKDIMKVHVLFSNICKLATRFQVGECILNFLC